VRGSIAILLLAGGLSGCLGSGLKSWRVQSPSPAQVVTQQHPKRIRITRADSTKIVVRDPSVIGDSLVAVDAADRRIALPLAEVLQVEVQKTPVAAAIFATVVGTAALVWLFASLIDKAASAGR
jgi:hypothetical protein